MPDPVSSEIRAELDQTPEWWDRQYQALVRKQIPRDPASHKGHEFEEPITFWGGGYAVGPYCIDCGIRIDTRT